MICEHTVKKFCKDDISKIENYELAINDSSMWHCHHRLELTINNEFANSEANLKRLNMYYNRPYFELIFLKSEDHHRLHNSVYKHNDSIRHKISINTSKAMRGKLPKNIDALKYSRKNKGMHWFTNGSLNVMSYACPAGYWKGRV